MFSNKTSMDNKYCSECKGTCLRKTSAETQKVAMEKFGIIPNGCVGRIVVHTNKLKRASLDL